MALVRRAIVIGGSIGGLSAALALRRAGCAVTVLEQRPAGAFAGAGLAMWPPALAVLAELGLLDALAADTARLGGLAISTTSGRRLRKLRDFREEPLAPRIVARKALLRVLRDAVERDRGIALRESMRCVSHRDEGERVVVALDSGEELDGELLVAADGIHSKIAIELGAPALRYSGRTSFRGLATGVASLLPFRAWEVWGVGRRMGLFDLGDGRVYYYLADNRPAGSDVPPGTRRAHLESLTVGWPAPIAAVLAATPEDELIHTDLNARDPFRGWSRGRVVLLGDAAHPMTPDVGQGACQAIEDAGSLGHHLAHATSLPAALAAYERHRFPRSAMMQRRSWRAGRARQLDGALLCAVRNFVVAVTPGLAWFAARAADHRPPVLALPAPRD